MSDAALVTGAGGFAGSHLIDHLLEHDAVVTAWRNPSSHPPTRHDRRVRWRAVNLLDSSAVSSALDEASPRVIYHCGGSADVGSAWTHPEMALRVNVLGTINVVNGARRAGLECPVLVTGSALVYRPSKDALLEDSPVGPSSPYGFSKLAQEIAALRDPGGRTFLARSFNHAGPRQSTSYVTSSFARQIAEIEAGVREPRLSVGNLEARRDITDVRDIVRAYRLMVERGKPGRPYNVCTGQAFKVGDLLELLLRMARVDVEVAVDPARMRPSDTPILLGDRTRLTQDTGWQPELPIEATLRDLLDYWRGRTKTPQA